MLDFSLILRVKYPVVDRIHPKVVCVENKATGVSKPNDSPAGMEKKYS